MYRVAVLRGDMFGSDRYPHSSSSDDTLGIFRYIDYASFYSKGLGWWHYGGVDLGGQSLWNLGVYSTPLGVSL